LLQSSGGVLYLEHLDSLPTADQSKLLRAIEHCEARPLGADRSEPFSVRFAASTSDDPRALIADNALREDLYYRLRGFEIHLPTLRDRSGDIPRLVEHFLGPDVHGIEIEALDLLSRASWVENVRQLRDVVEQAQKAAGHDRIGVSHLSLESLGVDGRGVPASAPLEPDPLVPPNTTLRDLERRAIIQAMKDCGGNRSKAARVLGIDRSTLRRKIAEFEIEDD
jgi:DNA-binding NtrC family response regulator